jgi:hypothetical protein
LTQQLEESQSGISLNLLAAAAQFLKDERDYLALHGLVTFEDVNCVCKYVTLLEWVLFVKQNFNPLGL